MALRRTKFFIFLFAAALILKICVLAAEPQLPGSETAMYKSYPYGNYVADAIRHAGGTSIAVIDNETVQLLADGGDIPIAKAELTEDELLVMLESAVSCVKTDSNIEAVVSDQSELNNFLQISGFFMRYDPTAPEGSRIISVEDSDGNKWTDYPVSMTAPEHVFKETGISCERVTQALNALGDYTPGETDDCSISRIRVIGTVDNNIVEAFPKWLVIVMPLAAALLVYQLIKRNEKWKGAHGVFLHRHK